MPDRFAPTLLAGPAVLTIRPLHGRTGLMLAGEADITTQLSLRAALAGLPADRTGDIHLDLTALRFIDLSCARELIAVADHHPAVRLIAHNPPASLLRITALLDRHASITTTGRSRPLTAAAERPPRLPVAACPAGPTEPGVREETACTFPPRPTR